MGPGVNFTAGLNLVLFVVRLALLVLSLHLYQLGVAGGCGTHW
jgi:hypothetical protein